MTDNTVSDVHVRPLTIGGRNDFVKLFILQGIFQRKFITVVESMTRDSSYLQRAYIVPGSPCSSIKSHVATLMIVFPIGPVFQNSLGGRAIQGPHHILVARQGVR